MISLGSLIQGFQEKKMISQRKFIIRGTRSKFSSLFSQRCQTIVPPPRNKVVTKFSITGWKSQIFKLSKFLAKVAFQKCFKPLKSQPVKSMLSKSSWKTTFSWWKEPITLKNTLNVNSNLCKKLIRTLFQTLNMLFKMTRPIITLWLC